MRNPEQALARLQEFIRFVASNRTAEHLDREVRRELHREGVEGMIKLLRETSTELLAGMTSLRTGDGHERGTQILPLLILSGSPSISATRSTGAGTSCGGSSTRSISGKQDRPGPRVAGGERPAQAVCPGAGELTTESRSS